MELEKLILQTATEPVAQKFSRPELGTAEDYRLPVAMAFVPAQTKPVRFGPKEGLDRGTLYPGLELPFKNNFDVRKLESDQSNELMSYNFAINELALYLDTHIDDEEATMLYNQLVSSYNKMRSDYVKTHGPIGHFDETGNKTYSWTNTPWPWENPGKAER